MMVTLRAKYDKIDWQQAGRVSHERAWLFTQRQTTTDQQVVLE